MQKNLKFLTIQELINIHNELILLYGGSLGIRDRGLLESALSQPQATFGSQQLHKDIYEKAAAYFFHIIKNHPFVDGNKRTACTSTIIFLIMNDCDINLNKNQLYNLAVDVANSKLQKKQISNLFKKLAKN